MYLCANKQPISVIRTRNGWSKQRNLLWCNVIPYQPFTCVNTTHEFSNRLACRCETHNDTEQHLARFRLQSCIWFLLCGLLMSLITFSLTRSHYQVYQLDEPCSFFGDHWQMQQCFNMFTDIYKAFLVPFHCCMLLEIKPITTTISRVRLLRC